MAQFVYPPQSVSLAGVATEATLLTIKSDTATIVTNTGTINTSNTAIAASTASIDTKLTTTNSLLASLESASTLTPVDQLDTPLLNTASTNIPASASLPLQVVASTAAAVYKLVSVEDIGEFIGVYTGAVSSEVLLCVMPLGGGGMLVNIPISTRVSLRNMKNAAISSGFIAMNLLG